MRARAAAIAAALFFCHHVMTFRGKYHPPLLFSFCSQYKSKKDIARHDILDSMHEMHVCTRFRSWRPPLYISEFVHISRRVNFPNPFHFPSRLFVIFVIDFSPVLSYNIETVCDLKGRIYN